MTGAGDEARQGIKDAGRGRICCRMVLGKYRGRWHGQVIIKAG